MNQTIPVIRADLTKTHQMIRWFGASSCWWAPGMGTTRRAKEYMRILFTEEGLGLNTLRVNIGGSVKSDRSDSVNTDPKRRGVLSPLQEDGTYNIRRCEGTWAIIQEAMRLGTITDLTLFMNSPPSTMTKNGKTSAEKSGIEKVYLSNLREDCYEAYAEYVADVTELYIEAGIPVKYVSPINEPQWEWSGGQEGCHYSPEECIRIMKAAVRALENRRKKNPLLKDVKLSLPETAVWWQKDYVHEFYEIMTSDPEIAPYIDHFCAHSYGTTRQQKIEFAETVKRCGSTLPLHQTEFGSLHPIHDITMFSALELACVLHEDFNILHTDSWTWWLGVGSMTYTDGLIMYDYKHDKAEFPKRYYVMKQHSRFLKNHTPVDVSAEHLPDTFYAGAYLSEDGKELVWELTNFSCKPITLKLEGFEGKTAAAWETSEAHSADRILDVCADEPLELGGNSVTTLVFEL